MVAIGKTIFMTLPLLRSVDSGLAGSFFYSFDPAAETSAIWMLFRLL
jgi:hypothetical protein